MVNPNRILWGGMGAPPHNRGGSQKTKKGALITVRLNQKKQLYRRQPVRNQINN